MRIAFHPARLSDYLVAALLLAAAADALFFGRAEHAVGLSASVLAALLALAVAVCHRRLLARSLVPHLLVLPVTFLALLENVGANSLAIMAACLAVFSMAAARRLPSPARTPAALASFLAAAPLALPRQTGGRMRARRRARQRGADMRMEARAWLVWIMPLALALGFALLLGSGNPILECWLAIVSPSRLSELASPSRIFFWLLVIALAWPFLRPRPHPRPRSRDGSPGAPTPEATAASPAPAPAPAPAWAEHVWGPAAILRALVLFNGVFAVQTLLDAAYLWGGLQLPEGVGPAAYAHRGAYTLVVTALLAAGFVLVALRPGSAAAAHPGIRALVHLWIGQNVVLVLSAMLRLDLYVEAYAMTQWRLAAFVWMGVVGAGLVLVCVRIAGRLSNRWLVGANLAVLALVVLGSCFVDDRALIAEFNVAHSRELSGRGACLDVGHLVSLGPAAIPAIDRRLRHAGPTPAACAGVSIWGEAMLGTWRGELADRHLARSAGWRSWTFRSWRLSRYLEAPYLPPVPPVAVGPFPLSPTGPN